MYNCVCFITWYILIIYMNQNLSSRNFVWIDIILSRYCSSMPGHLTGGGGDGNILSSFHIIGIFYELILYWNAVITFKFQAALLQRWNLPALMCPFCPFVQVLSVNVSIFTLTAIAIDRHRAILSPLRLVRVVFPGETNKCIPNTTTTTDHSNNYYYTLRRHL